MATDNALMMPFSMDAEQAVLGSVLIDHACMSMVQVILRPDDFYLPQHKAIFGVMVEFEAEGSKIDPLTVLDKLKADMVYDEAGGRNYLFQMAQAVPSTANVESYARIVREKARMRGIFTTAKEIANAAQFETLQQSDLSAKVSRLLELSDEGETTGENGVDAFIASLGKKKPRIFTGISEIDRRIGGLRLPSLLTIGAAPGTGKTCLALQIALHLQRNPEGGKAVFFSVEMDEEQIHERVSSIMLPIDYGRFTDQEVTDAAREDIERLLKRIEPRFVLHDDIYAIERMQAVVRREKPAVVVIDYAQIVEQSGTDEGRRLEVDNIIRQCRRMAKQNKCCVILLSQLCKPDRPGRKPTNDDLKETGAFFECSDYIFLLYRPFIYSHDDTEVNDAELIIGKNKFGATGNVKLFFQGEFQRFLGYNKNGPEAPPPAYKPPTQLDFDEIYAGEEGEIPW